MVSLSPPTPLQLSRGSPQLSSRYTPTLCSLSVAIPMDPEVSEPALRVKIASSGRLPEEEIEG